MLINLAGFVFAVGLTALVFSYVHRLLGAWGGGMSSTNAGGKWALRLLGVGMMLGSGALWSYSLSKPISFTPMTFVREPVDEWLALMDSAHYEDAWSQGAQSLQRTLSANEFTRLAEARRKPLGEVVGREQIATLELSSLPDGREGNFKLHIYQTEFSSGEELEETVVEEAESNQWKILNYNLGKIAN